VKALKAAIGPLPFSCRQSDFRLRRASRHFVDHSPSKTFVMKSVLFVALVLIGGGNLRAQSHFSFAVAKSGEGSPLIFIPGLDCSGEVWYDAAAHFSTAHTCYILTLPGFAGQPPIGGNDVLGTVVRELADYIRENHLQKPVIIGHSLGGWVALAFGIAHPELAGGLVIVSSAPFLPALAMGSGISVDSATRIGQQIKNGLSGQNPAQVAASQKMYLPTMIRDSARIDEVAAMAARSDQPTQGEVMYELFSRDLRPSIGQIRCPILALQDWSAYKAYGATAASVKANLEDQYKGLSKASTVDVAGAGSLTIALNDNSKHFIMFDEPQWFYDQVGTFIGHLK
jgi:pimeloyl-ACP methyl ester carboxylesterase